MSHTPTQPSDWKSTAGDLLACLAVLLAGGLLPPLQAGAGLSLLSLTAAAGLVLLIPSPRWVHLLFLPLPLLCAALPPPARPALLWLALALLRALEDSSRLRLASRGAALAALYAFVFSLPQAWFLFDALAAGQSRLLAALSGHPLRLGPGALLHLPIFFLLRGCAQWVGGGGGRRLRLALLGLLVQTAGLALALRLGAGSTLWLQFGLPAGALLLFLALDLAAGAPRLATPPVGPVAARALFSVAGVGLLALALLLSPPPARMEGLEVGFRRAGIWSAELPSPRDDSTPRLGGLMGVLRAFGAHVAVLDDRALEAGPPCRVLFVVQPDRVLTPGLRGALRRWMEEGGVLVAVGEHTHVHGVGTGLGSLLQDYHIRLRDDCAIPSLHGWLWSHDLRFLQSPATAGLRDSQDLGVSIGASLAVSPPAAPLVTGSLAFADTGDPENARGRMGNTRLDPGERLGEVPLVAAERVGRGMLVALGDKSSLMSLNNPLVWPFYLNLTGRLAAARSPWDHPVLLSVLLLMLALGLGPILRGVSARGEAIAALLAVAALAWPLRPPALPTPPTAARSGLVWIDQSHQADWWHPPDHDWSRSGIVDACFANGVTPLALPCLRTGLLAGSRTLLVAGPTRSYSRGERRLLRDYVERGGHLVVAGDGRRSAPLAGLLAEFGLALGDTPLGAAPEGRDARGRPLGFSFWEAWPVEDNLGGADTLASCWGYALALRRTLGAGSVTVVGDERIFSRWSLEGPSRGGSWHSTATRFRQAPALQPRPVPGAAKLAWFQRVTARAQRVVPRPGLPAFGRVPAAPTVRPAATMTRPAPRPVPGEAMARARWVLSLLDLTAAWIPPPAPFPGGQRPTSRPVPQPQAQSGEGS